MTELEKLTADAARDGFPDLLTDCTLVEVEITTDPWEVEFDDTLVDMTLPGLLADPGALFGFGDFYTGWADDA